HFRTPSMQKRFGRPRTTIDDIPNRAPQPRRRLNARNHVPRRLFGPWYVSGMGLLTFGLNVTLDGCCDHRVGIADDELHDYFTELMDAAGAMLWGRITYELMESAWPAV